MAILKFNPLFFYLIDDRVRLCSVYALSGQNMEHIFKRKMISRGLDLRPNSIVVGREGCGCYWPHFLLWDPPTILINKQDISRNSMF